LGSVIVGGIERRGLIIVQEVEALGAVFFRVRKIGIRVVLRTVTAQAPLGQVRLKSQRVSFLRAPPGLYCQIGIPFHRCVPKLSVLIP
jgi:hypothetical protein